MFVYFVFVTFVCLLCREVWNQNTGRISKRDEYTSDTKPNTNIFKLLIIAVSWLFDFTRIIALHRSIQQIHAHTQCVYHGSLSHTHKYILNYQRVQWRTNRRLTKWFICIRSVFKVSWLLVMCPEQSHRLSKGFVNRLWLWCVYHVVCEEMMSLVYVCVCSHKHCLSLELQAHTVHSCCLSTDFCTICTFGPCLSLCVVLSEKIAFLLYKASTVNI